MLNLRKREEELYVEDNDRMREYLLGSSVKHQLSMDLIQLFFPTKHRISFPNSLCKDLMMILVCAELVYYEIKPRHLISK